MTKILAVSFLLMLSGCVAPVVITGLGVASVATNEATGKGMADHAFSAVRDQDCRLSRMLNNEQICQDPNLTKLTVTTTGVKPTAVAEIEARYRQ